jgi:hypothetical protein
MMKQTFQPAFQGYSLHVEYKGLTALLLQDYSWNVVVVIVDAHCLFFSIVAKIVLWSIISFEHDAGDHSDPQRMRSIAHINQGGGSLLG